MTAAHLDALQRAGCVFAEEELAQIQRHLQGRAVDAAVRRRTSGLPLELAIGTADFAGVTVRVREGVFIPRARAEPIVDVAVSARPHARRVLDLGCGTGALAAAISARLPDAEMHVSDIDPRAVELARENCPGAIGHVGHWFDALEDGDRFDLVVAYLPHVPSRQLPRIHSDYRSVEPTATADGGADGLVHLDEVLAGLPQHLDREGKFVTLLAEGQVDSAAAKGLRAHLATDDDTVCIWP